GSARQPFPDAAGYVGFANLPNQVHRKSVKKGFEFTLMVVGESGLGKSTLINSLFLTDLYPERYIPGALRTCFLSSVLSHPSLLSSTTPFLNFHPKLPISYLSSLCIPYV
uniref:Zgc:63587 n=1 Tax=Dicentrarchus labrax TaxID=13489 RepID=A0A8C4GIE5_DICLA